MESKFGQVRPAMDGRERAMGAARTADAQWHWDGFSSRKLGSVFADSPSRESSSRGRVSFSWDTIASSI